MLGRLSMILVLLALVATGCGGQSKSDYAGEYQKAAAEFKKSVAQAEQQVPKSGATLKDRVPALETFKASIDKLATKLDSLDPPSDVAKLNDQAVEDLHTLSADLGKVKEAATSGDRAALLRLTPKLQSDQAQLQDVFDQIDQKING